MLDIYRRFQQEDLAMHVLAGRKSEAEKFPGTRSRGTTTRVRASPSCRRAWNRGRGCIAATRGVIVRSCPGRVPGNFI